jgi:hypothetical protein
MDFFFFFPYSCDVASDMELGARTHENFKVFVEEKENV